MFGLKVNRLFFRLKGHAKTIQNLFIFNFLILITTFKITLEFF